MIRRPPRRRNPYRPGSAETVRGARAFDAPRPRAAKASGRTPRHPGPADRTQILEGWGWLPAAQRALLAGAARAALDQLVEELRVLGYTAKVTRTPGYGLMTVVTGRIGGEPITESITVRPCPDTGRGRAAADPQEQVFQATFDPEPLGPIRNPGGAATAVDRFLAAKGGDR